MKATSLPATLRLLCALLLAVAVIAGPCQACFDPPKSSSAHDCCPSSKKSEQHQHNSSCSDVQVAVEQGKQELQSLDMIADPLHIETALLPVSPVSQPLASSLGAAFTPSLLTTLRC